MRLRLCTRAPARVSMKCTASPIEATIFWYSAANGEWLTHSRFQYSGWCRSAKPPSISARTKFIVIAECAWACSIRFGSGSRAASVKAGALMTSPR
ncbi:hypothetical protein D3C78_1825380 [compost metagenome]